MCARIKARQQEKHLSGGRILSKRGTWEFAAPRFNGPISWYSKNRQGEQHKNIGETNVANNEWHHVAVVYDKGTISAYVDGRFDGKDTCGFLSPNNETLWVGSRAGNADHFHRGGTI